MPLHMAVEVLDAVDCTCGLPIAAEDDVIACAIRCTMAEGDCCVGGCGAQSRRSCEQQSQDQADHQIAPSMVWLGQLVTPSAQGVKDQ